MRGLLGIQKATFRSCLRKPASSLEADVARYGALEDRRWPAEGAGAGLPDSIERLSAVANNAASLGKA
jgi:hypothetical protein